jgi:hypothetical protein
MKVRTVSWKVKKITAVQEIPKEKSCETKKREVTDGFL